MTIEDIGSKRSVLAAISAWEHIGGEAFRKRYGSTGAKRYFLVWKGIHYDLKLIMTAAHRIAYPAKSFSSGDFHTNNAVVVAKRLGFQVFVLPMGASAELNKVADKEKFDPNSPSEGRRKILASIVQRQGQSKFRKSVISAYEGKCALSGSHVLEALDAAHISPYDGPRTNHVTNGILLRADLHTLFDLHLLAIDPKTKKVSVNSILRGTEYWRFRGRRIRLPSIHSYHPSEKALDAHKQCTV